MNALSEGGARTQGDLRPGIPYKIEWRSSVMRFGSVCSGIEAASVAWHPLGWRAAWFAEVDRAASEVLAYRFPDVPNLGDMTTLAARVRAREIEAPDVLVGGTPCQAFSVAGLRRGLVDPRGQLTLAYSDLADAIDEIRQEPCIIVWENVPGVLTSKDNAFGCFLAGLAGEDDALEPPGGKWTNAGVVLGPQRAIAWRTLDAQYVGLAQRRRRVFVVASAREGFDPAKVLLEFDGVRRDSPPRRETGEGIAATLDARTDGGGFSGTDGACEGHVVPAACGDGACGRVRGADDGVAVDYTNGSVGEISGTLEAVLHKGQTMPEKNRFPAILPPITYTLRGEGFDASEDGTGRGMPLVPVGVIKGADGREPHNGPQYGETLTDGTCYTLQTNEVHAIAFTSKDYGADAGEIAPTLRSMGHDTSHPNGGGQVAVVYAIQEAVAFVQNSRDEVREMPYAGALAASPGMKQQTYIRVSAVQSDAVYPITADALRGEGTAKTPSPDATGRIRLRDPGLGIGRDGDPAGTVAASGPGAVAFQTRIARNGRGQPSDIVPALNGSDAGATSDMRPCVATATIVRRILPIECERLQGFPDSWTLVPTGKQGKPAADSHRYKQLGNSMAVPCMSWIGRRIDRELSGIGHNGGPDLEDEFEALMGP